MLNFQGWPQLWRFIVASLHPDLSPALLQITGNATIVTLSYAVCSTTLTATIGMIFGILSSRIWWDTLLGNPRSAALFFWPIRLMLAVPRGIHELLWGLFLLNIWGLNPLTAIVAIAIPFSAITAKVFSEILDNTPTEPLTALRSSGVKALPALLYGLLPSALLNLLAYTFYRFECALRSATVLGLIGAGGLGYEILISLQSLKYEQLWTFFYALIILNGIVDYGSNQLRQRWAQLSQYAIGLSAIALIITGVCGQYLQPDYSRLGAARSQRLLGQFLTSLWPPDFSITPMLFPAVMATVMMSIVAILIAAIGGLLLAFPASRSGFWSMIAQLILLISRSVPAPIWALVILYVVFPGILPGAIALGIHNLGILGRLMTTVIQNVDRRPVDALQTMGVSRVNAWLYGVLPLIRPDYLAYSFYRWEVCMRETVVVGLVGAGGLGRLLTEQLSSFDGRALIVTLAVFLVLTFAVDVVSFGSRRFWR
jgi:phosphonate transport system permease protein